MRPASPPPPPVPPLLPTPTPPMVVPPYLHFRFCRRYRVGKCEYLYGACGGSTSIADTPLSWYLPSSCEFGAGSRVSALPHSPRASCCIPYVMLSAERRYYHCYISVVRCTVPADAGTGCVVWILRCRPSMLESRTDQR